ncbi:hypothetical protein KCU93_g210, partial [Aureobasidium melanogenum]
MVLETSRKGKLLGSGAACDYETQAIAAGTDVLGASFKRFNYCYFYSTCRCAASRSHPCSSSSRVLHAIERRSAMHPETPDYPGTVLRKSYPKLTRLIVRSVTVKDTSRHGLRRVYVRRGDYVDLPCFILRDGRLLV